MKFYIHKLGCPKNDVDADTWIKILEHKGHKRTFVPEDADMILVNTCGFINEAKEESIEVILSLTELKKNNENLKVYAIGCMSEVYGDEMLDAMPEIDGTIGNRNIPDAANSLILNKYENPPNIAPEDYGSWYPNLSSKGKLLDSFPHAYLKIAEGCSNICTYCMLPKIRGANRCLPPEVILDQMTDLIESGFKEIIIVAQDTSRYLFNDFNLAKLLENMSEVSGDFWIRLMYTHPAHITPEIIKALKLPHVVPYLDMPIQHISDNILQSMNRKTNGKTIRALIDKLKTSIPDIVLRTTVMTGFPGESQDNFDELCDFIAEDHFLHLGAFAFSPQEGTIAYDLPNFSKEKAEERRLIIEEIQEKNNSDFELVDTKQIILTEANPGDNTTIGRMREDAPEIDRQVRTTGEFPIGEFIEVQISAEFNGLFEAESDF